MDREIGILAKWLRPLGAALPKVYLVGGAVRDHLLGRAIGDIDLMCPQPEALARRLQAAHGLTLVPFLNKPGAPCIRAVNRSDPADFLDLVPIHGGSVERDLGRRDFTINAMALRLLPGGAAGGLVDPLDGRGDLRRRVIRAAGPGALREDPLRVLRAVRFAAELGFAIEPQTLRLMREAAGRLATVAAERVVRELFIILERPASAGFIRILDAVGALEAVLPEIVPMKGCGQNAYHHRDVWGHTLEGLEHLEDILGALEENFAGAAGPVGDCLSAPLRKAVLKLAVLLHDCGKPAARGRKPGGGDFTFHRHDTLGASLAAAAGERLRLSADARETLALLVRHHMHLYALASPEAGPKALVRWFRRHGERMIPLILLYMADTRATRGPALAEAERERLLAWGREAVAAYYGEIRERLSRKPLVTGRDLAALGMAPGPAMGRVLRAVREAQDAGTVHTAEQALILARMLGP
jgi:poly(A) polymerase